MTASPEAILAAWRAGKAVGVSRAPTHLATGVHRCPWSRVDDPELAGAWLQGYDDGWKAAG